jgi:uncharacterized membrane protein
MHSFLLYVHVCSAAVGLISGVLAMFFRKGSGLHRASGDVFTIAMLSMSGVGAFLATFMKPNNGNVMGGVLTFYVVATAWMAGKRREREVSGFDRSALLLALGVAAAGATWGFQAAISPTGLKDGYPPPMYFIFAAIALLFAASDIRMIVRGGYAGTQRIVRHLVRMCLALLFAIFSFYPGQARLFPRSLRDTNLLFVPHALLVGAMLFALYRNSSRKRVKQGEAIEVARPERTAIAA